MRHVLRGQTLLNLQIHEADAAATQMQNTDVPASTLQPHLCAHLQRGVPRRSAPPPR